MIILITTKQEKVKIRIESEKTFEDLIYFYFKTIKRLELFNDPKIVFLLKGSVIEHQSKVQIKKIINESDDKPTIVVADIDEKIGEIDL